MAREPTRARIRDWSPPLKKTPVESRSAATAASGVGVRPAAQSQFPGLIDAELAENPLVLGVYLVGKPGCRGDQGDPGLLAAGQLDEPFQDPGAAAPVLPAADDQQAARWHTVVRVLVHGCVVTQRDTY